MSRGTCIGVPSEIDLELAESGEGSRRGREKGIFFTMQLFLPREHRHSTCRYSWRRSPVRPELSKELKLKSISIQVRNYNSLQS